MPLIDSFDNLKKTKDQQQNYTQPVASATGYNAHNSKNETARLIKLQKDIQSGKITSYAQWKNEQSSHNVSPPQNQTEKQGGNYENETARLIKLQKDIQSGKITSYAQWKNEQSTVLPQNLTENQLKEMAVFYDTSDQKHNTEAEGKKPNFLGMFGNYVGQGAKDATRNASKAVLTEVKNSWDVEKTLDKLGFIGDIIKKDLIKDIGQEEYNNRVGQAKEVMSGQDKLMQNLSEKSVREKDELNNKFANANTSAKNTAQFLGEGVGGVLPSMAASLISPTVGSQMIYAQSVGQSYEEAMKDGATHNQAYNTAIASGLTSAGVEKLAGGIPIHGKGVVPFNEALSKFGKGVASKAILSWAGNALGEGIEEGVEAIAQPFIKQATYGKPIDYAALPSEVGTSMLGGAAIGGILGGAGDVVNGVRSARANKTNSNATNDVADKNTATISKNGEIVIANNTSSENEISLSQKLSADTAMDAAAVNNTIGLPNYNIPQTQPNVNTDIPISTKIQNNLDILKRQPHIRLMTGEEFAKSDIGLVKQVGEFFKSLGNKISRPDFGEIIIDENSVQSDIAHGLGRKKAITFASVPDVIQRGKQIDYQPNWKGRGKDSYIFAAPVKIGEETAYVATVVLKDEKNKFYLHEVVDGNGNVYYTKKETPSSFKTELTTQGGVIGTTDVSNTNIPQPQPNVNISQQTLLNTTNVATPLTQKTFSNLDVLSKMQPVVTLQGHEFAKSEKGLTEQVSYYFDSLNNKVTRQGFGDIVLNTRSVKSDIAHGVGRAKAVTFASVPDVLKKGIQIDYQPNWKNRGYDSYVFAAPVNIAGQKGYVSAVVIKNANTNDFYLHEVIDQNGNVFKINKETPQAIKTGITVQDGITGGKSVSYSPMLPQPQSNVNISQQTQNMVGDRTENVLWTKENITNLPQKTVTLQDAAYAYSHNAELPRVDMSTVTKNGQEQIDDSLNITVAKLINSLSIQGKKLNQKQCGELKQFLNNTVVTEMLNKKAVSKKYLDEVFETVYYRGIAEQNAFALNYGDIIDIMDKGPVLIDLRQMTGAGKRFNYLVAAARNNVMLSDSEGVTIAQKYDELAQMHPNLFKQNVKHDIDKLATIIEVTKAVRRSKAEVENFNGERQVEYKGYARKDFDDNINNLISKLNDVNNLARKAASPITSQAKAPTTMSEISQAYLKGEALPEFDASSMTNRGKEHMNRLVNNFVTNVANNLSVQGKSINHNQRKAIKQYAEKLIVSEYLQNGKVEENRLNEVFEAAYKRGAIEMENFYTQYKDLGQHLKNTVLTLDAESQKAREYIDIMDSAKRLVKIQDGGVPVDVKYMELANVYPNLFSPNVLNPLNQLEQIVEVARAINKSEVETKNYYSENEQKYKTFVKEQFSHDTGNLLSGLKNVARYEASKKSSLVNQDIDISYENVVKANTDKKRLSRQLEKVQDKYLLTPGDKAIVEQLLKGSTSIKSLDKMDNIDKAGILDVYNAKKHLQEVNKIINANRIKANEKMYAQVAELIKESDTFKDKVNGLAYSTDTPERNIADITKNSAAGKKIVQQVFKPVHENEALATKFKNRMRDTLRPLKLNKWETQYAQMLGEKQGLEAAKAMKVYKSEAEIETVLLNESNFYEKFKGKININKVQTAINAVRKNYDEIIEMINKVYIANGLPPIEYRQGYFPHFREQAPVTLMQKIAVMSGFKINTDKLPTDINGKTHIFKPNSRYNPNAKAREGFETDYDLIKGFDSYIEVATDVIYHTEDIRRIRAFEMAIREKHGDEGTKKAIKNLRKNTELTEAEIEEKLDAIRKNGNTHLSNLVNYLTEYANSLANKKTLGDRGIEQQLGRGIYTVAQNLEQRMQANMIAGNVGSWLTNLIPLTQLSAECSQISILQAMKDTVNAIGKDDGFVGKSVFLTNREGSQSLVKTKIDLFSDKISQPMQYVDMFTSNIAVRAKYLDNIKAGMDSQTAMDNADAYGARLIADRSKGALPTIFNHKNPLFKLLTMFQVETNNQLRYIFKDLPRAKQDGAIKSVAWALAKMMLGAYLYNDLYEKLTGRRPALDVMGVVNNAIGDFSGKKLNNVTGIVNNQGIIFSGEKKKPSAALGRFVNELGGQVPFVGGLLFDGGRIPINGAMPNLTKISTSVSDALLDDGNRDKASEVVFNELSKPFMYLVPPAGGGALKKALSGTKVLLNGGSYTKDNEGKDKLRFAVENPTLGDAASTILFGPYSTKGGREYIQSGFKSLSAKKTALYKSAIASGMDGNIFREFLEKEKDIKADKNAKGNPIPGSRKRKIQETINVLPLTVEQKMILYAVGNYGEENEEE